MYELIKALRYATRLLVNSASIYSVFLVKEDLTASLPLYKQSLRISQIEITFDIQQLALPCRSYLEFRLEEPKW